VCLKNKVIDEVLPERVDDPEDLLRDESGENNTFTSGNELTPSEMVLQPQCLPVVSKNCRTEYLRNMQFISNTK